MNKSISLLIFHILSWHLEKSGLQFGVNFESEGATSSLAVLKHMRGNQKQNAFWINLVFPFPDEDIIWVTSIPISLIQGVVFASFKEKLDRYGLKIFRSALVKTLENYKLHEHIEGELAKHNLFVAMDEGRIAGIVREDPDVVKSGQLDYFWYGEPEMVQFEEMSSEHLLNRGISQELFDKVVNRVSLEVNKPNTILIAKVNDEYPLTKPIGKTPFLPSNTRVVRVSSSHAIMGAEADPQNGWRGYVLNSGWIAVSDTPELQMVLDSFLER